MTNTINGDKHIVIEYFNINKIKSVTYECPLDDYSNYRLTLFFEEKVEEITLNSKEDTNEHWKYKFDEAICSIAKYFCTNK